jgi:hypothetical protein
VNNRLAAISFRGGNPCEFEFIKCLSRVNIAMRLRGIVREIVMLYGRVWVSCV